MNELFPSREILKMRLVEAMAWCSSRLTDSEGFSSLRSPSLKPTSTFFSGSQPSPGESFSNWYRAEVKRAYTVVESLADRRSAILQSQQPGQVALSPLSPGKLILYNPFCSSGDGLAAGDTAGFFDKQDAPPWDTFLYYFFDDRASRSDTASREHLMDGVICWIPAVLTNLANAGIRCNPFESIKWLHPLYPSLHPLIKDLILLIDKGT